MSSNRPFTVLDGRGAEVQVQTGTAPVKSITPDSKGVNANVEFRHDNLKFKVSGWIPMKEPVFKKLESSLANGSEVEYRLESQRRHNIAADIPFEELSKDALNTVRKLLVYVDGDYTSEAVTLAENDPFSSGRVRQQPGQRFGGHDEEPLLAGGLDPVTALATLRNVVENKTFDQDVVAALVAQALLAGLSAEEIWGVTAGKDRRITESNRDEVRPSFSPESPSWSEFNKDGRPNLGSLTVQAGVGVEKFVRAAGAGRADIDQVRIFSDLILAIADRVQEGAYGTGFRVSRGSSSHSLIRSLVYDTITEQNLPIPFSQNIDVVKGWVARVGSTVRERFNTAISIADTRHKFTDIYAEYQGAQNAPVTGRGQSEESTVQQARPEAKPQTPAEQPHADPEPQRPRESQSPNEQRSRDWADLPEKAAGEESTASETPEVEPEAVESSSQPQNASEPVKAPEQTPATADEAPRPAAFGIAGLSVGVPSSAKTAPARKPVYEVDEADESDVASDLAAEDEDLEFYDQQDIAEAVESGASDGQPSLPETRQALVKLVRQANITDNSQVTALLRHTFGLEYDNSANIPNDLLQEFIDHYATYGPDNFRAVAQKAAESQ